MGLCENGNPNATREHYWFPFGFLTAKKGVPQNKEHPPFAETKKQNRKAKARTKLRLAMKREHDVFTCLHMSSEFTFFYMVSSLFLSQKSIRFEQVRGFVCSSVGELALRPPNVRAGRSPSPIHNLLAYPAKQGRAQTILKPAFLNWHWGV